MMALIHFEVMPPYQLTDLSVAAFVVIPILLFAALVWGVVAAWQKSGAAADAARRAGILTAVATGTWMAITWLAGANGALRTWDRMPPPFGILILGIILVSVALAFSPAGRNLSRFVPLWALVGVQGFRLPLELAMHEMYDRGIMPAQMTYTGRNFDIVTGATAIIVAVVVAMGYGGRRLVAMWNVLGFALLVNIIVVAVLSTPVFGYFGRDRLNTFVTYVPFVWLPAVMVTAALAGHLIVARALARPKSVRAGFPMVRS